MNRSTYDLESSLSQNLVFETTTQKRSWKQHTGLKLLIKNRWLFFMFFLMNMRILTLRIRSICFKQKTLPRWNLPANLLTTFVSFVAGNQTQLPSTCGVPPSCPREIQQQHGGIYDHDGDYDDDDDDDDDDHYDDDDASKMKRKGCYRLFLNVVIIATDVPFRFWATLHFVAPSLSLRLAFRSAGSLTNIARNQNGYGLKPKMNKGTKTFLELDAC